MLADLSLAAEDFVSIDIEGDGNDPPSPVEICAVEHRGGKPVSATVWLINPGKPMSAFVQGFHGITDAMVADAPRFGEIEADIRKTLQGRMVVGFAAANDLLMLRTVMPDVDGLPETVIDAQRMAKTLLPGMARYRLEAVCKALGLDAGRSGGRSGFHAAETDAVMAGQVFLTLLPRIPDTPKHRRHYAGMAQIRLAPPTPAAGKGDEPAEGGFRP